MSTTNPDEVSPLMLRLSEDDRRVPARVLELKLRALRNLYATVHLLSTERSDLNESAFLTGNSSYSETLLEPDEYFYVECLASGIRCIKLWSKAKESCLSIIADVAMTNERGRDVILRKLEAEARAKELEAETKECVLMTKRTRLQPGPFRSSRIA